jgi:hypothetical protein
MSAIDKIKMLFRRKPLTEDEFMARAQAKITQEQLRQEQMRRDSIMGKGGPSGP